MYTYPSRIRYSETDEGGRLTVLGLLNYFQDCSLFQSEQVGLGLGHLAQNECAWMIAAWQIEVERMPRAFEDISVSTWGTGVRGLFASRNFLMVDDDGATLARADSLWFLYDFETGKPRLIPDEEWMPYCADGDAALDMPRTSRKLTVEGDGTPREPIHVAKHHLDTNHHVNNAQYIEIAREALPEPMAPRRIQVQYRRSAVLGDVMLPVLHREDGGWGVELLDANATPGQRDASFAIVRLG